MGSGPLAKLFARQGLQLNSQTADPPYPDFRVRVTRILARIFAAIIIGGTKECHPVRRLITAVLSSMVGAGPVCAADVSHFTSKEGREVVTISGQIVPGDADRLVAVIREANALGREVSGVRLNSPGGNLQEGAKIADAVRFAKIATVVMNGTTCASACFVALAAGTEKFVSYTAHVGVHGASTAGGSDAPDGTVAMAKIVKQLGVPSAIIGQMVVTPPDQIVWLSPTDLQTMSVKMTGKPMQTAGAKPTEPSNSSNMPTQAPLTATLPAALPQTSDQKWSVMVADATAKSSAQNGGRPNFVRNCQPELGICNTAIVFKGTDGNDMMVRAASDADGKPVSRDLCAFNSFGDVRQCLDWDKGTTTKEMKNASNEWVLVSH